ncbi:MAG: carbohydrate binding family 9 domain-containing protein [Acidobacteria bacterium]|nr:carbohydrate binding family 9 domain-containing protein [Acidobacteriota bacterium]
MQSLSSCSPFLLVVGLFSFSATLHGGDARTAKVYRLQDEQTIQVDGILDEAIWQQHETIGELIQAIPRSGEEPSERTDVRVAYGDNAVYIAVHCFDRLPEEIVAQEMSRDATLFNDDYIQLLLDTFHDGRNAYYFQTNPLGALVDGRITESGRPDTNWDGVWYVQVQVVDDGWTAEFEIPFKTLSFQPDNSTWGFNIS